MSDLYSSSNMRCKYCIYGGNYEYERTHANNQIDVETLKNGIEFFFKMSESSDKIINFYGGEPFLEFDKIEYAVEYIDSLHDEIKYYVTTNATLINDRIIRWFSSKTNVELFVSLGGVPYRHDEVRVLANEEPTFDLIKCNLMKLKEYDELSYKKRVHFAFNIFSERQLIEISNFWNNDPIFSGLENLPEITFIDCVEDNGSIRDLGNCIANNYDSSISPLFEYISLLKAKNYNNVVVKHFDNKFLYLHRRQINNSGNILSGVCKPFVHKLFIDVFGNINICENFKFGDKFGDVHSGVHFSAINDLLSTYRESRYRHCKQCWAMKLCSLCYRDLFDRDGNVNHERAMALCEHTRESKLRDLVEYCTVLEQDETLLSHLDEYVVRE